MTQSPETKSPPSLPDLLEQFGQPMEEFRPSTANLIAGIIIGVVLIGGGSVGACWCFAQAIQPDAPSRFKLVAYGFLGIIFAASGVTIILFVKKAYGSRLLICPKGFVYVMRTTIETCRWDEIRKVTEQISKDAIRLSKSKTFKVHRTDGKEFSFSEDDLTRLGKLSRIVREEVSKRNIPWETVSD